MSLGVSSLVAGRVRRRLHTAHSLGLAQYLIAIRAKKRARNLVVRREILKILLVALHKGLRSQIVISNGRRLRKRCESPKHAVTACCRMLLGRQDLQS